MTVRDESVTAQVTVHDNTTDGPHPSTTASPTSAC